MPQIYLEDSLGISCAPNNTLTDDDLTTKNISFDTYTVIRAARVERQRHVPKLS